jgi:hypothetical protein
VQGFQAEDGSATVENVDGHSELGARSLAIRCDGTSGPARVATPTFIPPEALAMKYTLLASPTLYPGQTVRASVTADEANAAPVTFQLRLRHYDGGDRLAPEYGPDAAIAPGDRCELTWRMPDTGGQPIAEIGLEVRGDNGGNGTVYLDHLTWDDAPEVRLGRPEDGGTMWRRAWIDGVDQFEGRWPEPYRIVQNHGTGLISQGTQEWTDYHVSAPITIHLAKSGGIAARVGGLRRYYALLLCDDGMARLVKALDVDTVLAERAFQWDVRRPYDLSLEVTGNRIVATMDGAQMFDVTDDDRPLLHGGVGLVVTEGCLSSEVVSVRPV